MTRDRQDDPHSVGDVLDRLKALGEKAGDDPAPIGDVVDAMGHRAYGPFFILLPVVEMSPVGGIPGLPTAMAAMMVLLAAQLLFGREKMWLPGFVRRRGLKGSHLVTAADKTRPIANRMDKWFHGRLPSMARGPMIKVAAVAVILLCLTVPPLELLPFASTAPMLAIMAFGVALLVRDGALMLVACVLALAATGIGAGLLVGQGLGSKG